MNKCVWGAKVVSDERDVHEAKGTPGRRKSRMVMVDGANHFVRASISLLLSPCVSRDDSQLHWYDPERMLRLLAQYA